MNILGYNFGKKEKETWAQHAQKAATTYAQQPEATFNGYQYPIIETYFDGEKTTGELGAPLDYIPDYTALSYRSWQAYRESDLAQIILKAHLNWVIGSGLKLQAEPIKGVIESEGYNFEVKEFAQTIEERFRLYAKTNNSMYNNMMNYNKGQRDAYLNAIISGDVLCVEMVVNGLPSKRLIDGTWVQDPGMDYHEKAREAGHEIIHGVRVDEKGKHVGFYVRNTTTDSFTNDFTYIEAYGKKTGRLQAYLLYGMEGRINEVRGIPLLTAVLEKIKKLDRYNEAIVANAEESAKVPWFFKHSKDSTGQNPDLAPMLAHMEGKEASTDTTVDMSAQTTLVKRTYEKEPINLPVGADMDRLMGGMEKDQEAFTTGNFIYICAALEIPYEVALMKYVNSFSSSRMASQSYLFILNIKRTLFNDTYNKPFYKTFLDLQILTGKVKADGYFSAMNSGDVILMEAYQNCRFTGPGVPQADPFKEVKAEQLKKEMNWTSNEEAMEKLGGSDDFVTTIDKLSVEENYIKEKIPQEVPPTGTNTTTTNTQGAD